MFKQLLTKSLYPFLIIFLSTFFSYSQTESVTIKDYMDWAWLGVDYSNCQLVTISNEGFKDLHKIRDYYFLEWNRLIVSERDKYNIKDALKMDQISYHEDYFDDMHYNVKLESLLNSRKKALSEEEIKKIVTNYPLEKIDEKIAVVFIAENLNKSMAEASYWVTIINTENNKVIVTERMIGRPGGFGLRNYWARPIYEIIENIKLKKWKGISG